ncbi:putative baseplate assembly protein [Actinoplanes hulinensis]|uniref:Baseplate assembly protein n=1 Tax=Actinoplanes hulinensis TaxID=1144547 RepID=A0ABS7B275_9ACTN|nr:putative baseplate assembly protein [Actinoplanes hulinensis]MBW6435149.1 putative baseplate assembly protein [Actinoplanes hulinensis]
MDHGTFLSDMLDHPALRRLTVRTTDDPAIALLDAAAVVADLLTFHGDRIAAEGYLRTARDRRSLGLLGRLVDYRPRPGLAADTHLAYRLDARSQPAGVLIPRGSRSRSVPASAGEQPQTFETDADLLARAAWNELAVRRQRPDPLTADDLTRRAEILVAGTNTLLVVGDRLLFEFGDDRRLIPVARLRADRERDVTAISLPGSPPPSLPELIAELRRRLAEPRPSAPLVADVDRFVLAPLEADLDQINTPEGYAERLAGPIQRLTEAAALAGPRQDAADWFDRLAAVLADLADRALGLGGVDVDTSVSALASTALTGLFALRVVATPFGATAPLQPVRDQQGRVINLTDWPLPGATLTTTRIVFDTAGRAAVRAEFIHAQPEGTVQHSENLPIGETTFDLGPGQVAVTGTATAVTVSLRAGLPTHELTVATPTAERRVAVTVDGQSFELSPGDTRPITVDGQVVTVRHAPATQPASLEIVVATVPDQSRRAVLSLNAVHQAITVGSPIVVERAGRPTIVTRVAEARPATFAMFGITGRGTQLTLDDDWLDERDVLLSQIRDTTVYAGGEPLTPAGQPLAEDVHGDRIELADRQDGLRPGRILAVTGAHTELATIAAVEHGPANTTIVLADALAHRYPRDTVRILGNVVPASHGETRDDPLGSGDATAVHQSFTLWQEPLTWLPSEDPSGARPALEIRVDGLLWQPVDSLDGRGPAERVYVLGNTPDGRTTVTFGDGAHGARLPTGQENVRARHRFGAGPEGNLPAGRITQPVTRPLGVIGVTNPVPASGGADPDGPGLARRRIPLAVSTLDRLVSARDYADFTRSRVGIGRAAAWEMFDGRRRVVHVTVAAVDDVPLDEGSDLVPALRAALAAHGDPRLPVRVDVRDLVALRLVAGVKVSPGHSFEIVAPRLERALLARLGYSGRDLARDAYLSDVLAVADRTPGVDYMDVAVFAPVDGPEQPLPVVPARPASYTEQVHRVTAQDGQTVTSVAVAAGIPLTELARLNPGITSVRPLPAGSTVTTFRGIRPAQFAVLAAGNLTLTEIA